MDLFPPPNVWDPRIKLEHQAGRQVLLPAESSPQPQKCKNCI